MDPQGPNWLLPNAAWQAVARSLPLEDLLSSRAVCSSWRRDLSAFIIQATSSPTQLLALSRITQQVSTAVNTAASSAEFGDDAARNSANTAVATSPVNQPAASMRSTAFTPAGFSATTAACSPTTAVHAFLAAFPYCETLCLDISSADQQQLAHQILNALASSSSDSDSRQCQDRTQTARHTLLYDSCSTTDTPVSGVCSSAAVRNRKRSTLQVCLDAMQRSYHCVARQEYPGRPDGSGPELFKMLASLPQQLTLSALNSITSLQLDICPEQPQDWLVLQQLPGLRELLLPGFKPAVPHQHLSALAQITQLTAATLSVQGSFTSWRANCDAFSSLSRLTGLTSLTLHAFHCPGQQLMAALAAMRGLVQLRLSGRVVLEPLSALHQLTGLQVLELTQDVQYSALCELVQQLSAVTQLALGRVNLPPAAASQSSEGGDVWQPDGAVADAGGVAVAHPAAAEAAAVVVAADVGGGGAAAAAAAADGGVGEVMLEDVGAIVDGLVGNLQEGNVPVHLQHIIERFESIIQLDLTRSTATSPWGWPVLGVPLLEQLDGTYGQAGYNSTTGSKGTIMLFGEGCATQGNGGSGAVNHSHPSSSSSSRDSGARRIGCSSLELALLRPNDVVRLDELPQQVCCCRHLGLRLRDQLLAFASVCPIRLAHDQLSSLGSAFTCLQSLSVCGKVAIDGITLCQLAGSVGGPGATAAPGVCCSRPGGLVALSLDCHFVMVSPENMIEALQSLQGLKVLSLRHRGQGRLPLPANALPRGLTTLAVKKVLLYKQQPMQSIDTQASSSGAGSSSTAGQVSGCRVAVPESSDVHCHAITSPGFRRAAVAGNMSTTNLASLGAESGSSTSMTSTSGASDSSDQPLNADQPVLPGLESLLLKNCLVSTEAIHLMLSLPAAGSAGGSNSCGCNALGSHHLTKLSITGDNSSHTEVVEGWSTWLQVIGRLKRLQVLDLAVPESVGCSLPAELLQVLLELPCLAHLHLTTGHQPLQLLGLTGLRGIRTISLHYSGPPALPSQLLGQLQAGVGPHCKVRLWEMLVLQHVNSFGGGVGGVGGGVDAAVEEEAGVRARGRGRGRRVMKQLAGVLGWSAFAVGGWWCGWMLGGALEHSRLKRRSRTPAQQGESVLHA